MQVRRLDPIAYSYDADLHCPPCAVRRFGREGDGCVPADATDDEGNRVGVLAPWGEWWEPAEPGPQVLVCATCGTEIDELAVEDRDDREGPG